MPDCKQVSIIHHHHHPLHMHALNSMKEKPWKPLIWEYHNFIIFQFHNLIILPYKVVFSVFLFVWLKSHRDCDDDVGFCLWARSQGKGYVIITRGNSLNHTKRVLKVFVQSICFFPLKGAMGSFHSLLLPHGKSLISRRSAFIASETLMGAWAEVGSTSDTPRIWALG